MIKKKTFIIGSIAVLLLISLGLVYANITGNDNDDGFVFKLPTEASFYEITADQLRERIDDKSDNNFMIVDIRDDASFDEAHIPGAVNIPLNELGYRWFSLDKSKDIIVYCFTGVTSQVACQILVKAGFKDVYNMTGGIKAWDYAIETSDGRVNI